MDSGHGLTGFSASGTITRLQLRSRRGLGSYLKARIYFQAHVVVGKIGSLQAVEPRPLVPSWLLAGGCPQFLATWAAPAWLFTSKHASQEGNRESPQVRCKLQSCVTWSRKSYPITFTVFHWLEWSHKVLHTPKGRTTQQKYQELGICGSCLRIFLPQLGFSNSI